MKYKIKFAFLAAIFSLVSTLTFGQGQSGMVVDKIIARVDNYFILKSDLEELYQSYQSQNRGTPDKCELLESLIINKMLLAKAEIDSVLVDDKNVEGELDGRMAMMIQKFGSEKNLASAYGKSPEALKTELRQQVKEQLLTQTMQEKIAGNVKITPREVSKFFHSIPKDSLPFFPSDVEVGHIVRLAKVTPEQKQKLITQLKEIKKKVEEGEDFAILAQTYSEDVGSARNGGDLGFQKRGKMVPEFEGAAVKLKPNEMSDIVESQFGYHLIQLLGTRGSEYHSRHILLRPDYNRGTDLSDAKQYLDSLRNLMVNDTLTFAQAAKLNSEDPHTADSGGLLQNPQTGSSKHGLDGTMESSLYFALDTMKVGDITLPLEYRTDDGRTAMRLLWYKSKSEPHVANLRDDYERIAQSVLENKKNSALEDWFKKAKGDVYISVEPEFQNCTIFGLAAAQNSQ